jgi:hypothetical protein
MPKDARGADRPTRGRPRIYGDRLSSTVRFLPEHHEFLQLVSFLKGMPITRVLEEAIDEYSERHRAELQELQAKKVKLPRTRPASQRSLKRSLP